MPKPMVFWRTDVPDEYVHTISTCSCIAEAKTVRCGTIEEANEAGHVKKCILCEVAEKSQKQMVEKTTARIWVFLTVIIMGNLCWMAGVLVVQITTTKDMMQVMMLAIKRGKKL